MKSIIDKGFTLVELAVVIVIIVILSGLILASVTQYINKGKDSSVFGNLVILIPAGEGYYNVENATSGDGYHGFCSSTVATRAFSQMPTNTTHHCNENSTNNYQSWAACAKEFANSLNAYCVDSRGIKGEILNSLCNGTLTQCPD